MTPADTVTDHAVLRCLERVHGVRIPRLSRTAKDRDRLEAIRQRGLADPEAVRADLVAYRDRVVASGFSRLTIGGFQYVVGVNGRLVTVAKRGDQSVRRKRKQRKG